MKNKFFECWLKAERYLQKQDAVMDRLIEFHGPCRLSPRQDYFVSLCESIISQQLAAKAADAINSRFAAHFGGNPEPEKIAATAPETLRGLGLSSQKSKYIQDLAQKFLDGHITPDRFAAMTDRQIIDQLIAVKGIGVWTVQIFLIFSLNRPDVFPVDDLGIKKAIQNLYSLPNLPAKQQMLDIAQPWHPYATVASWYLWRSLNNK